MFCVIDLLYLNTYDMLVLLDLFRRARARDMAYREGTLSYPEELHSPRKDYMTSQLYGESDITQSFPDSQSRDSLSPWKTDNSFSNIKPVSGDSKPCTCTSGQYGRHNVFCGSEQRHQTADSRNVPSEHIYELPQ